LPQDVVTRPSDAALAHLQIPLAPLVSDMRKPKNRKTEKPKSNRQTRTDQQNKTKQNATTPPPPRQASNTPVGGSSSVSRNRRSSYYYFLFVLLLLYVILSLLLHGHDDAAFSISYIARMHCRAYFCAYYRAYQSVHSVYNDACIPCIL
jgi:hypothetical protein